MNVQPLDNRQLEQLYDHGYVTVGDCFSREAADEWVDLAYRRLGYDRRDPSTWLEPRVHLPTMYVKVMKDFAPKAWAAACQLMGGEDRIHQPANIGDSLIFNFGVGKDLPWQPPGPNVTGWHKDGDFFRHFLDSPEQALLTIILWTDVTSRGGGTFVARDSVPVVARFLRDHPEGVPPDGFSFQEMVKECRDFVEVTGSVGDVVLLHPYILHSVSQNVLGVERAITNPPFHLIEPMKFRRSDPSDYSPVETSVLRALGVESLDFLPQAPRENLLPSRVLREREMMEEHKRGLDGLAV